VNGTSVPCDCGAATTCTNGKKGTCSVPKMTLYLDSDGDGHGNPAQPGLVCPSTPRYVESHDDCDDGPSGASLYPGASPICSTVTERKWCTTTSTSVQTEYCFQGCLGGVCRPETDGTVGVPEYVSCDVKRCPASQGCNMGEATCGTTESPGLVRCDGPNDCPGAKCCVYYGRGGVFSQCETGACPSSYYPACDPKANTAGCSCTLLVSYFPIYACM
jgi:hypothetical protein